MERKKLLVVDDEPRITSLLYETFSPQFDVITAQSGEEAIKRAILDHPHCILMDVMMPQMGGFMLCDILKSIKQTKLIPILMVTGKPRQEFWPMAQEMGALDYIEKPFTIEQISTAVKHALKVAPIERRRCHRVRVRVPVFIRRKDIHGQPMELHSETENVSQMGAMVRLPIQLTVGEETEIRQGCLPEDDNTANTVHARIIWNDAEEDAGSFRHGMELLSPATQWTVRQ